MSRRRNYLLKSAKKIAECILSRVSLHEILIFGSLADPKKTHPGDIDMMIIDDGEFSDRLNEKKFAHSLGLYKSLEKLFHKFMEEDLGLNRRERSGLTNNGKVDMIYLKKDAFYDPNYRAGLMWQHYDPAFFEKAFSKLLRYDLLTMTFVPTTIEELKEKYEPKLSTQEWLGELEDSLFNPPNA